MYIIIIEGFLYFILRKKDFWDLFFLYNMRLEIKMLSSLTIFINSIHFFLHKLQELENKTSKLFNKCDKNYLQIRNKAFLAI